MSDENSTQTILVADDDPNLTEMVSECLTRAGYKVLVESDGRAAYSTALYEKPSLLLLDVRMGEMDGFEVLRQLREIAFSQKIPIIMMTAIPPSEAKQQSMALGAKDYLPKPFTLQELLNRVRKHLPPVTPPPESE